MVPDWIAWSVPFASGIVGIYTGLKVGVARLEVNFSNMTNQLAEAKAKLVKQVGEDRCDKNRMECAIRVEKTLGGIERHLELIDKHTQENQSRIAEKFEKITIYMAKHDGG